MIWFCECTSLWVGGKVDNVVIESMQIWSVLEETPVVLTCLSHQGAPFQIHQQMCQFPTASKTRRG